MNNYETQNIEIKSRLIIEGKHNETPSNVFVLLKVETERLM